MRARLRDRRWLATRVALPAAAIAAVGIPVGIALGGGDDASAADGDAATATATAAVARRTLVDRERFNGTLGYADCRAVANGLDGTVTTAAPEGEVRRRGGVLYRVDEQPVALLYGATPVYRPLAQGDEGTDVLQLERNLMALGYDADGALDQADDDFGWATAAALRDWQEALGIDETGRVDLGQVVFLPGPRRIATVKAGVGASARMGQAVVETCALARTVTVQLDARRQDLVAPGDRERVVLPDGTEVTAEVTDVGAVATTAEEGADPTVEVTLGLPSARGVTALDAAPVEVELAIERAKDVLSVPVTALLALAGGGFGLEVRQDDGSTRITAVDAGLTADGWVEVSGDGIAEGDTVVVAE